MNDMTWDIEPDFIDLAWADEITEADYLVIGDDDEDYPYTLTQGDGDYDDYVDFVTWDHEDDDRDYYLGDCVD